jgi:hypothetical protein
MRKITFRVVIAISGITIIWLLLSLPNTLPLPANNNSILRVGTINLNYENKVHPINAYLDLWILKILRKKLAIFLNP